MAEFYIETNAQPNGDHYVHFANCTLLPAKDAIHYLGSIASSASAIKRASEYFKNACGCPQCAPASPSA